MKSETRKHVWIGEGRWRETQRWYILFSTCTDTKRGARDFVGDHPNYKNFDRIRVRKYFGENIR